MPDQWERHSRPGDGWDPMPSRSQQRRMAVQDDPVHDKVPGRKDPDRCKGNKGGPHAVTLVKLEGRYYGGKGATCGWSSTWSIGQRKFVPGFFCYHEERCTLCGKRFRWKIKAEECPDYKPDIPQGVRDKCDEDNERRQASWNSWSRWRKPVITGPSHYRKPKAK